MSPLTVLSNDNLWSGPVTLRSTLSLTYQGIFSNTVLPTHPVSVDDSGLIGTGATMDVATTTTGSSNVSGVETFTFGGTITGGTFTLTVYDGLNLTGTTAPTAMSSPAWPAPPSSRSACWSRARASPPARASQPRPRRRSLSITLSAPRHNHHLLLLHDRADSLQR